MKQMRAGRPQRSNFRALILIVSPLILSACLSSYLIFSSTSAELNSQADHFAQGIADHMAISVADHLINEDRLSLNVLLSKLLSEGNFDFASVYNYNNDLLAQVGRAQNTVIFTKDVSSQNAIAGHIQLGFDRSAILATVASTLQISLGIHFVLILSILILGGFYGDFFYLWMMQRKPEKVAITEAPPSDNIPTLSIRTEKFVEDKLKEVEIKAITILALKVRPSRLFTQYEDKIRAAHSLYGGHFELTDNGDIMICFDSEDQLPKAIYTGLLVLSIFDKIESPITIKAGIHHCQDTTVLSDYDKAKKHTSYLASISEGQLLSSRLVHEISKDLPQFEQDSFHGSMAPDGQVFSINALSCKDLIESQAEQI